MKCCMRSVLLYTFFNCAIKTRKKGGKEYYDISTKKAHNSILKTTFSTISALNLINALKPQMAVKSIFLPLKLYIFHEKSF